MLGLICGFLSSLLPVRKPRNVAGGLGFIQPFACENPAHDASAFWVTPLSTRDSPEEASCWSESSHSELSFMKII